tara:strand:- start:440 stop:1072 length:633 start_codon:yes stop_codon:yes gene_type:complete
MSTNLRKKIIDFSNLTEINRLNRGTSGNLSARNGKYFLITPSGIPPKEIKQENIVKLDFNGKIFGSGVPSSEWKFHKDLYKNREDINAIIHTHSTYASSLSCLRKSLPAFHYMIAIAGGDSIRCAPYALFGTETLSKHVLNAIRERKACLLSNHGLISVGKSLEEALSIAIEIESLCEQYIQLLQCGGPKLLSKKEMQMVLEKFVNYGPK